MQQGFGGRPGKRKHAVTKKTALHPGGEFVSSVGEARLVTEFLSARMAPTILFSRWRKPTY